MQPLKNLCCLLALYCFVFSGTVIAGAPEQKSGSLSSSNLLFVENKNQWQDFIRYKADIKGGYLFLENNRFTYVYYNQQDVAALHPGHGVTPENIRMHAFRVSLNGSSGHCKTEPGDEARFHYNYFIGNDPSRWASDVRLFKSVLYRDIYPSIDLRFYSRFSDVKYDFVVNPGASTSAISMSYDGTDKMELIEGNLKITTSIGEIIEEKPYAYQVVHGVKREVPCTFRLKDNIVRFLLPAGYDHRIPLVIDPTLVFSSFTGSGADNWGFTATYDAAGNAYGGGNVNSIGYPATLGAYQLTYGGGGSSGSGWACDMAIAKFSADGSSLLYATYLGGSNNEQPQSLIVDSNNDLFIFGVTYSTNFPFTTGAYRTTKNSGSDMVICKLSPNGNTLLGSTFMGGAQDDGVNFSASASSIGPIKFNYGDEARGEVLLDASGNCLIASCTRSSDFPVTPGSYQGTFGGGGQDGVLFSLNSSLTSLNWSTFLGGTGLDAIYSCVIGGSGNIYATGGTNSSDFPTTPGTLHPTQPGGTDGFISHISANGSTLLHSTYIGTGAYDQTFFVQRDFAGNVYTTGQTEGTYPVTPGVYSNPNSSQFIHELSADLSTTIFSTVFGNGSSVPNISPTAFLVDTCGNIYVSGWGRCILAGTLSNVHGMPVTSNALQSTTDGCDFYFIVLSRNALALQYGSFFGGNLSEEHVDGGTSRFDANGVIYQSVCAGCGGHSDFPTTPGVVSNTNNSSNCNNAVMKIQFNFSKTRAVAVADPASGCAPLPVQFTNNSINGITYTWDFDDGTPRSSSFQPSHTFTDTGVHQVMLISRNNQSCNLADTVYIPVIVTPAPPVNAAINVIPAATCDSMSLQVAYTGTGGNIFQWSFGDGDTSYGLGAQHTYSTAGTYIVTLIARDTVCPASDTVSSPVTYRANVVAQILTGGVFRGCAPQTLTLESQNPGRQISWHFDDGTDLTGSPVVHVFPDSGHYQVRLIISDTGSCNLADTSYFDMDVFLNPTAGFYSDGKVPYFPNTEIQFSDTSLDAIDYLWDFGDETSAIDSVVSHTYRQGGSFEVCLTVTSVDGCLDSACKTIEVTPAEGIYVPNSFTPNHDGNNEYFFPVTIGILDMKVRIFNRWGQVVAEWTGLEGKWDGRYKGKPAKQDVYLYEIDAVGSITPVIKKVGRVTLVH